MRTILAVLAIGLVLTIPAAALGVEDEGPEPAVTTTLDPDAPVPAEEAPAAEDEAEEQPWTSRFLTPAIIVGTIVLIAALLLYYLVRIWGRYRVVEQG